MIHLEIIGVEVLTYRIAGNFHGLLIFVTFVTNLTVTKFCTPQKFATVGKGCLEKSCRECAHNRDRTHGISPSC